MSSPSERRHAKQMVEKKYGDRQEGRDTRAVRPTRDFRKIIERKDIDAVVIATPDHWHAIPCILAARAKKDIYCEKPLTHDIAEGRRIVDAVAKNKVIFQTGSQQRERVRQPFPPGGRTGSQRPHRQGEDDPHRRRRAAQAVRPADAADPRRDRLGLLARAGAGTRLQRNPLSQGIHNHFPAWRNYREFGGGGVADMGAHHFDIAQWALDMDGSGPVQIIPPEKGDTGLEVRLREWRRDVSRRRGRLRLRRRERDDSRVARQDRKRSSGNRQDADRRKRMALLPRRTTTNATGWNAFAAARPRSARAEIGHRSATVCHLCNIGYRLRKPLRWDPVKERFDDDEANKLRSHEPRDKWKI